MSQAPNLELVQNYFRSSWSIYQEIVQLNYMDHEPIYNAIHQYLITHYPHPFSLLELGCGDASWSALALKGTAIETYTGVDLAPTGLELAAANLLTLNCSVQLQQQEMQQYLASCPSQFDLILVSFALHHLPAGEKQQFLEQCWHHLNPGGTLLLIDVFCREGESRPEYLTRYCGHIKREWQLLTPQTITAVTEHISSSDFPESVATVSTWSRKIGFEPVKLLYLGTQEVHTALALSRG